MSRKDDLQVLETEIKALETRRQAIVVRFQSYAAEVAASIKTIMTDAGVWDSVHELEIDRERTGAEAQQKVDQIQSELADKRKIHTYLLQRESQNAPKAPAAVEEPVVAEAPTPSVDVPESPEEVSEVSEAPVEAPAEAPVEVPVTVPVEVPAPKAVSAKAPVKPSPVKKPQAPSFD